MKTEKYQNMLPDWNVWNTYEDGDMVLKGDTLQVYDRGVFKAVPDVSKVKLEACRFAIDQYHKEKGLPGYDEIMRVFFEANPEYRL